MMDTLRAAWQSAAPFTSTAAARIAEVVAAFLADGATDRSMRDDLDAMDVTVAILTLLGTTGPDDPGRAPEDSWTCSSTASRPTPSERNALTGSPPDPRLH